MIIFYIITFSLIASIASVCISGLFLYFPNKIQQIILPNLISFATGTLLGTAFLGLIPQSFEKLQNLDHVLLFVIIGLVIFIILEKIVIWRHCHKNNCDIHETSGALILIGDSIHNFIDGIIICTTFLISIPLGVTTALSIMSHEIPQEVGDFAILLKNKYSIKKAFTLNIISGLSSLMGALLAYFFVSLFNFSIPYIMAICASSFIYIAISDLIPHLQKNTSTKENFIQIIFLFGGILLVSFITNHHIQ